MTTYNHGEIVVVNFPVTSGQPGKRRPSLVVFDSGDADVVIARLTTKARQSAQDVAIADWAAAGLRASTIARLHKLMTVEKTLIHGTMGRLSAADYRAVSTALRAMFGNW